MLGAGAFGTVWMASNRETGCVCAIKIVERKRQLHEDFSLEPAEAEILKKISHPNIVQLIDLISTEVCVYLVMELVLGGHLQARLKAHGAYAEPQAKVLLRQVSCAVQHLHERNIIHRDIKPENILFTYREDGVGGPDAPDAQGHADAGHDGGCSESGGSGRGGSAGANNPALEVKLTDFGLSTMKEGRLTTRCGTPSYCAPELVGGEGYGKAVDIWSLGVLSYVVLTGGLPFVGKDRQDLFARIQRGQYAYPAVTPGVEQPVSERARDLIARLLKLEPMERYSTRELLQHPWMALSERGSGDVTPDDLTDVENLDTVHEMLRKFNAERRLRRAMHVVIACVRLRALAEGAYRDDEAEGAAEAEGDGSDEADEGSGPRDDDEAGPDGPADGADEREDEPLEPPARGGTPTES